MSFVGKPLGPNGLSWLKLHCINLTGKYKRQSVTERHRVAEQVLPDILDSANNPLSGIIILVNEQFFLKENVGG